MRRLSLKSTDFGVDPKIKEYGFEEFKERVLGLEKESARKCKQEGYDSQTEAYTISKLLKAKSPEEIIKVF